MAMPTRESELCTPAPPEAPGVIRHVTQPVDTPEIDEEAEGALLRFRSMADLLGRAPQ
jgi:hypothetical protein